MTQYPTSLVHSRGRGHDTANQSETHSGVYRSLFDLLGVSMVSLDTTLRVQEGNGDFYREFQSTSSDACGRSFFDFVHQSGHVHLRRQFAGLTEGRRSRFTERVLAVRAGDAPFPGEVTGVAAPGQDGDVTGVIVMVKPEDDTGSKRAVTDRKKILTELDARILEGVAAGVSTVQLASKLYLSRGGIEYHVGSMMRELKAPNRAALVSKAYSMGALSLGTWPPRVVREFVSE